MSTKNLKYSKILLSAISVISLSSCGGGGGGVGSTPAPSPAPSPSPSPTPTPVPTPTPTTPPVPTPTPTPAVGSINASLNPLTATEDFTNDSVLGSIGISGAGALGKNNLIIHYDAVVDNYTLFTNGDSEVFTNATRLPQYTASPGTNSHPTSVDTIYYPFDTLHPSFVLIRSAPGLKVYTRTTSSTVDQLILSSNTVPIVRSSQTASNADIILSYAGFGSWFNGDASGAGSIDYFSYGSFTADSAMPRTGTGTYLFTMDARLVTNSVYFVSGEGTLTANFGTGGINFGGNLSEYSPSLNIGGGGFLTTPPGGGTFHSPFEGTATIAANSNHFAGTFNYWGSVPISGVIDGRFYGPSAQEVGAVFSGQNANGAIAGAFVGSLGSNTIK